MDAQLVQEQAPFGSTLLLLRGLFVLVLGEVVPIASPSLSFGTTTPNEINGLGAYLGVYGTTFV